jgi:hypothetical protein
MRLVNCSRTGGVLQCGGGACRQITTTSCLKGSLHVLGPHTYLSRPLDSTSMLRGPDWGPPGHPGQRVSYNAAVPQRRRLACLTIRFCRSPCRRMSYIAVSLLLRLVLYGCPAPARPGASRAAAAGASARPQPTNRCARGDRPTRCLAAPRRPSTGSRALHVRLQAQPLDAAPAVLPPRRRDLVVGRVLQHGLVRLERLPAMRSAAPRARASCAARCCACPSVWKRAVRAARARAMLACMWRACVRACAQSRCCRARAFRAAAPRCTPEHHRRRRGPGASWPRRAHLHCLVASYASPRLFHAVT